MYEVFNVGETILLDGELLSLVTCVGVERWIEAGAKYTYRYDQVRDPLDGQMKYEGRVLPPLQDEGRPWCRRRELLGRDDQRPVRGRALP